MSERSNHGVNRILAANPSSTRVMIARTQANKARIQAEAAEKEEARKAVTAQVAAENAAQHAANAAIPEPTDPLTANEILQRMHDGRPQDIAAENSRRQARRKKGASEPLTADEATVLMETGGIDAVLQEADRRTRQATQTQTTNPKAVPD